MTHLQDALEALRSFALPPEFKRDPRYRLDKGRYHLIGKAPAGVHKPLSTAQVQGLYAKAHWNIHKGGYSLKPPHDNSTLGHATHVRIGGPDGVRFEVQESGRQRVLSTGEKNPHAFVHGIVQHVDPMDAHDLPAGAVPVGYSPKMGHFFSIHPRQGGGAPEFRPLHHAREVFMIPPHPDKVAEHKAQMAAAIEGGMRKKDFLKANKAPIGRVYATLHEETPA